MTRRLRRAALAGAAIVSLGVLTACSGDVEPVASPAPSSPSSTGPSGSPTGMATTAEAPPAAPVAISHIHAVARDPKSGELLLATHEGLFRQTSGGLRQSGPVIDLMSFTVGPDGTYFASGHPGAGTDLPQPVGLITSTDSGRSWQVASRGGQSDFHALSAGPDGVTGYDGALRTSSDHRTWTSQAIPEAPRALAAAPGSGTLLATTSAGLFLSKDKAASWRRLSPPETALLVSWADDRTIVTVSTAGHLATSSDAGGTWTLHPQAIGAAEALHAQSAANGGIEVIAVVDGKVIRTLDGGATTEVLVE